MFPNPFSQQLGTVPCGEIMLAFLGPGSFGYVFNGPREHIPGALKQGALQLSSHFGEWEEVNGSVYGQMSYEREKLQRSFGAVTFGCAHQVIMYNIRHEIPSPT